MVQLLLRPPFFTRGPRHGSVAVRFGTADFGAIAQSETKSLCKGRGFLLLKSENALPVVLHADNDPAFVLRLVVERLGKGTDLGIRQCGSDPHRLQFQLTRNCFIGKHR